METSVTAVGNLTKDPELKFVSSGKAVANFSIAVNKKRGETEYTSYYDITAWGDLAENVASTLTKGTRVIVVGQLNQERFETNGQKRSAVVIVADAVGEDLRFAKGGERAVGEAGLPF
jgi:single-strand DNA-binding protein